MRTRAWGIALLLALAVGCSKKPAPEPPAAASATAPATSPPSGAHSASAPAFDALDGLDDCTLGHSGVLLDLGDASTRARLDERGEEGRVETAEREGATWASLRGRSFTLSFTATADDTKADAGAVFVEARVRGAAAKNASVFLNGKPVGSFGFARGETRVVAARGGSATLVTGTNEILVRFGGSLPRGTDETLAEIDWIHVGTGDVQPSYAAPTRADAVTNAAFGGVSRRALALRAPGIVRCTTLIPSGAHVQTSIAIAGSGEGDAEIRLHRDRLPAAVLARVHVSSATPAWSQVDVPVGDLGPDGAIATLEFASVSASHGARLLFGQPRVVGGASVGSEGARPPPPPARGAVLVIFGGYGTKLLSPYGGSRATPELAGLAANGTVFDAHHASASFASGAVASMLTGASVATHGVIDGDARLPTSITTVADAAHQAGIATALFTATPTTSPAFGFGRGWDKLEVLPPLGDVAATRLFDEAGRWIDERRDARFLLVVHARGAHPPWDVTAEEMRTLPPPAYSGPIDPKHAAEVLAPRGKKAPTRLTDADRTRVWALLGHAVDAHDEALGRLLGALRSAGREADTAIFVTSDVATHDTSPSPFAESDPTDEAPLAIPLVMHLPGPPPPTKRVRTPTESGDVARSLLAALGLAPPSSFGGLELQRLAEPGVSPPARPVLTAGGDRFVLRWGRFVLFGTRDRDTKLCDTLLEPACLTDVQATHPIALDALHRAAFDARWSSGSKRPREPATIDPATAAALKAWGR